MGGDSSRPKECALRINSAGFYKVEKGSKTQFHSKWSGKNCKNGSRIRLDFNFQNQKCSVFFNGQVVGDLSKAMPNQIQVIANTAYEMTLSATEFKCISR